MIYNASKPKKEEEEGRRRDGEEEEEVVLTCTKLVSFKMRRNEMYNKDFYTF